MRRLALIAAPLALAACTTAEPLVVEQAPPSVAGEIQVMAINDFHGRLEAPERSVPILLPDGSERRVPSGGAAYLKGALDALDTGTSITVAAGDMIGASPLTSALFLDEPTIDALDLMELDYSAIGNHEFDKGVPELMRLIEGGCETYTTLKPCAIDGSFDGADFLYLAANVFDAEGRNILPDATIHEVGGRRIGVIGMPLVGVPTLVAPNLVDGLVFADEATTANALVPRLLEEGAETIVLLIHEGARINGRWDDPECPELSGAVVPMLDTLDETISVVVSGHTHAAYNCRVPMPSGEGERLLTSAGAYGALVTDIRLTFGPEGFSGARATNIVVQGDAFTDRDGNLVVPSDALPRFSPDAEMAALVAEAVEASRPMASRVVGSLTAPAPNGPNSGEGVAGYLIADAQWAATSTPETGGADFAFMNAGGVRSDLPAGAITYGDVFEMQPFQNSLMTITLTGAQVKAALEQMFVDEGVRLGRNILRPSFQLQYAYDASRAEGDRIVEILVDGQPIDAQADYRVTVNNFVANGGDGFSVFKEGTNRTGAGNDVDALIAWIADGRDPPELGRIRDLTPAND